MSAAWDGTKGGRYFSTDCSIGKARTSGLSIGDSKRPRGPAKVCPSVLRVLLHNPDQGVWMTSLRRVQACSTQDQQPYTYSTTAIEFVVVAFEPYKLTPRSSPCSSVRRARHMLLSPPLRLHRTAIIPLPRSAAAAAAASPGRRGPTAHVRG